MGIRSFHLYWPDRSHADSEKKQPMLDGAVSLLAKIFVLGGCLMMWVVIFAREATTEDEIQSISRIFWIGVAIAVKGPVSALIFKCVHSRK